jgi:hypothetical protein
MTLWFGAAYSRGPGAVTALICRPNKLNEIVDLVCKIQH